MTSHPSRRDFCATAIATVFASTTSVRAAEKKYDQGASDSEIKIGQTVPHSGPGSLYGVLGRVGEYVDDGHSGARLDRPARLPAR